ncbi:MAG: site-specific integrase [Rhodospirillaceae bacterium]|jgi:integrase
MDRIELINRGKEYYLQATIPDDLIEEIGKPVIEIPLNTTDIVLARDRFFVERLKLAQSIRAGRKLFDLEELNTAFGQDISKLCKKLFNDKVKKLLWEQGRNLELEIKNWQNDLYANEWSDKNNKSVLEILSDIGMILPCESLCFELARKQIARTILSALTLAENLKSGGDEIDAELTQLISLPDKTAPQDRSVVPIEREIDITVDQMIELFLSEKRMRWANPDALGTYKIAFRALREIVGAERKIKHITRADGIRMQDILSRIPKNPTHLYPHLTLEQAAKQAETEGIESITKRSSRGHLIKICSILNWAVKALYLSANPLRGFGSSLKGEMSVRRWRPFTIGEMNELFQSPVFTGCKSDRYPLEAGEYKVTDSRYWVPLIAPWTGMRLMEICQLEESDIQIHAGIDVISVSKVSLEGEGDDTKAVKSEAGNRLIPIHPELVKLGFLDFVKERRKTGKIRLFPEVSLYKNRRYVTSFSPWFRRVLNSLGYKDKRLVFHSFRHSFRDALREGEVNQEAVWKLGGWSPNSRGTDAHYGEGLSVKSLYKAIKNIEYPGLEVSHLYREDLDAFNTENTGPFTVTRYKNMGKGVWQVE